MQVNYNFIHESKFTYQIASIVIQAQNLKCTLKTKINMNTTFSLPKLREKYKDSLIQIRALTRWCENYKDSHIQTRALTGVSITFSKRKDEFKRLERRPFENRS